MVVSEQSLKTTQNKYINTMMVLNRAPTTTPRERVAEERYIQSLSLVEPRRDRDVSAHQLQEPSGFRVPLPVRIAL